MQSLLDARRIIFLFLMGVSIKFASSSTIWLKSCWRAAFRAFCCWPDLHLYRGRELFGQHLRVHAIRNLSGVISMWMGFYAMLHLPLGLATTLNYTSPLFIAAFMLYIGYYSGICARAMAAFRRGGSGLIGVLFILTRSPKLSSIISQILVGLLCGALAAVAYMSVRSLGQLGEPEWRTVMLFSMSITATGLIGMTDSASLLTWLRRGSPYSHCWASAVLA